LDSHFCLVCGDLAGVDILLNTLLFVPLGVGLSLSGLSLRKAVFLCFAVSLSIETAQVFIAHGRDATLRDILTNTIGGAIGFWAARTAPTWLAPSRKRAAWLSAIWGAVWLLIQIISSYAFVPSLSQSPYDGHVAHQRGGMAMFHGEVDTAKIGTIPISDGALADSRAIRQLLINGAPIVAVVRLIEPTTNFASLVAVADHKQQLITSVAEQGDQLVFGIRTGASRLRLRQPAFAMPGVFAAAPPPADSAGERLVVSARLNDGTVQLTAETPSGHVERSLSPRAELAWTVVLPHQWLVDGRVVERVITFLWTCVLLIPLGYWAATLMRWSTGVTAFAFMAVLAVLLGAGLIVVPVSFGLKGATLLAWIAAVSGLGTGVALALASLSPLRLSLTKFCL
jgi:hypothetical protein